MSGSTVPRLFKKSFTFIICILSSLCKLWQWYTSILKKRGGKWSNVVKIYDYNRLSCLLALIARYSLRFDFFAWYEVSDWYKRYEKNMRNEDMEKVCKYSHLFLSHIRLELHFSLDKNGHVRYREIFKFCRRRQICLQNGLVPFYVLFSRSHISDTYASWFVFAG